MKKRLYQISWYVIGDYLAALGAWYILYQYRKVVIEGAGFHISQTLSDSNFLVGLLIVPQFWLLFHYLTGTYTDLYRKSRLQDFFKTLLVSLVGTLIIFFTLLLDDLVRRYSDYYYTFLVLYTAQTLLTLCSRMILLNIAKRRLRERREGFNTLIIGSNAQAAELYEEFEYGAAHMGYFFKGYITIASETVNRLTTELPTLGDISKLEAIIHTHDIEEVIIAIESHEHHKLNDILNTLAEKYLYIRIIPDMYDILSGTTRMNSVVGEAFIEIRPSLLTEWQRITKRWWDVGFSVTGLILTAPLLIAIAAIIKATSRGPIFYSQERLGQYGVPFKMHKFRSMYTDAEQQGPRLTVDHDPRVTPIGRFIRQYRIDELPQFINVIMGDMSIVGPRAERKFFADQILLLAPHYKHVLKVKPGITSMGMVKYGYASTVDEMVKRLKYDLIYIENMNMAIDFKIMIYTVQTVLYGRGK
jgi:exopolysaccharide biosynthesis polyprenyl glycosylphosphotransferase